MLPPTVPTDPVPAYVDPLWCRVATRSEVRNIVDRALRHGRRRRLVIADRRIGTIADHMFACGFLFLRSIWPKGTGMSQPGERVLVPGEPSNCPDLAQYRQPRREHFIDVATYAIEVIGGEDRDKAWSAAFEFGSQMPGLGNHVLWRAGTVPPAPWRISEVWAAEEATREAERRRWPSWDDW